MDNNEPKITGAFIPKSLASQSSDSLGRYFLPNGKIRQGNLLIFTSI